MVTRPHEDSDLRYGIGDLYPLAALRWNSGVNNWMAFADGDIPVGTYDSSRLANFGIGHGAVDGGGGYTYFDPQTGHEFSLVTGLSYNLPEFEHGLPERLGLASRLGRFAVSVEDGANRRGRLCLCAVHGEIAGLRRLLGANLSRVAAVGPQLAFIFPTKTVQTYLSFKAYWEFASDNRASGWNAWVTLSFSPSPEH